MTWNALLETVLIRGCVGDSDQRNVQSVLRQLLPDAVDLVDAGVRPEAHAVPHALPRDVGGLDVRFHSHQRKPRLEVVGVGRIRERAHLEEVALLGRAGLARLLRGLAYLALGDRLLLPWEDAVEIEPRLFVRL